MDAILRLVEILNQYLWNSLLLVALVGTGVYFTIRLGFVQVRKLGQGLKFTLGGLTTASAWWMARWSPARW